ncbi:MAG: Holliday junction DNA helicase RuvA [Salibacteraceae bacterium]|jgi:Holliday junction DNA helicase RuvA
MIEFLKGRLAEKNPSYVVVDCNGLGYYVNISLNTFSAIGEGEAVSLFIHLSIREDAHVLYGFADKEERAFFRQLISVSGVGASTAQMVLSSLAPAEAMSAILNGDVATLQSVKGIGGKTAQRIIIDLKDKIAKIEVNSDISLMSHNTSRQEALSALFALGFDKNKSTKMIDNLLKSNGEAPVEELVKMALKKL